MALYFLLGDSQDQEVTQYLGLQSLELLHTFGEIGENAGSQRIVRENVDIIMKTSRASLC